MSKQHPQAMEEIEVLLVWKNEKQLAEDKVSEAIDMRKG